MWKSFYNKCMRENKTYSLYSLHLPVIVLAVAVLAIVGFSYAKVSEKASSSDSVLGKKETNSNSDKSNNKGGNGSANSNKPKLEDFEPKENGKKYQENIEEVVGQLEVVADVEEEVGNTETSEEIDEVANAEDNLVSETAETIETIEKRPKWKDLLFPDYKNLGQLRSDLAHNTNSIRKLTKALDGVEESSSAAELQAQLDALNVERERIATVITTNESEFSVLGWVVKFLTGYKATPIEPIGGTETDPDPVEATESTDL